MPLVYRRLNASAIAILADDSSSISLLNNFSTASVLLAGGGKGRIPSGFFEVAGLDDEETPEVWQTWFYGLLIVTAASFLSPLAILSVPLLSKSLYDRCMTLLVALGIGAMSGSCFHILIPHAFNITDLENINYVAKSWLMAVSLYTFFVVDRGLQCLLELRRRRKAMKQKVVDGSLLHAIQTKPATVNGVRNWGYSHSLGEMSSPHQQSRANGGHMELREEVEVEMANNKLTARKSYSIVKEGEEEVSTRVDKERGEGIVAIYHPGITYPNQNGGNVSHAAAVVNSGRKPPPRRYHATGVSTAKQDFNRGTNVTVECEERVVLEKSSVEVASVAYMIIFGSSANNFVDGMSTGAAFSDSIIRGMSIGLAVLSQQFPQELGTLAILVNSGLGMKRTIQLNMIPIALSYLGFAAGVVLDTLDDSYDSFIFSVSTGMYLYIFLGTLIPEIRFDFNETLRREEVLREAALITVLQFSGIGFGLFFLYFLNRGDDHDAQ